MDASNQDAAPLAAPEPPETPVEIEMGSNDSPNGNNDLRLRRGAPSVLSSIQEQTQPRKRRRKRLFKRKRLQWIVSRGVDTEKLSEAQEQVFLTMQLRKMRRRVHGRKVKTAIGCELCTLAMVVLVIFLVGFIRLYLASEESLAIGANNMTNSTPAPTSSGDDLIGINDLDDASSPAQVTLVLLFIFWIMLAFVIISKSPLSPWWRMAKWLILYLPILYGVTYLAWTDGGPVDRAFYGIFIFAECVCCLGFVIFYKVYPLILRQQCFSKNGGAGRIARCWRAGVVSDWTITYAGLNHQSIQQCKAIFSCKYEGDTCPDTGMPHGLGRWLDDAWEGEMITGYWKQGQPVAPFSSWSYGTDDAVAGVRVAYFIATDDPFERNHFHASNAESLPTCGVASVECSVSGAFYNHLPEATLLEGPYACDEGEDSGKPDCYKNAIQQCIRDLNPIKIEASEMEEGSPNIEIRAGDPRGIQVVGHMYQPTGKFFASDTNQITVQVNRTRNRGLSKSSQYEALARQPTMRFSRKTMFLPKVPSKRNSLFGKLVMVDIDESDNEDGDEDKVGEESGEVELVKAKSADTDESLHAAKPEKSNNSNNSNSIYDKINQAGFSPAPVAQNTTVSLRVQDWIPAEHKEALIFLPGYNSCTKDRLENFGQFLAMSKMSSRVYPFVFCWPGSVGPGYFEASRVAGTSKNSDNLLKLVASIRSAGIRTVHFMTHSMGAQALLGAFQDEYNEKGERQGRSHLSLCFQLDPSFDDEERMEDTSEGTQHKLICKTITMLNPDFPLEAFVDRAFLSIRRICRAVTVVGDRNDRALWWSSLFNGVAERRGYEHCSVLRPQAMSQERKTFRLQERIGSSIDSLYFPPEKDSNSRLKIDKLDNLVFKERASLVGNSPEGADADTTTWLDMDVIDMTGLDTNIAGLRHSGFSLNGMLLKDLEELLTTGRRAMKRSTLVYRDGNMFSYAHAPSFVSL